MRTLIGPARSPSRPGDPSGVPLLRSPEMEASSTPAGSLIGRTIGDFAIDGVIGAGSFGTVYRGRQLGLDRPVAIKVPSFEIAADPVQAQRFAREARAAARIVHPGVVAIYAVGELDDGRPYLAMQLIDGEPLDRILASGPLPALRALRIVRGVASALSETHAAGVIHRDLKPSNVMWRLDRNGDDRITLVDFGIAVCRPGHADASRLTSNGLIGTPHYMSPELAQGEHVDGRADLYALGCLLFELTTGTTPFDGSGFEVLLAHLGRPVPRPSERAAVPPVIDQLVEQLMQKRPDDRPASADAVVALLDEAITERERRGSGSRRARTTSRITRPGPVAAPTSRRRTAVIVLAVLAGLALSGAGFAGYRLRGGDSRPDDRVEEPEPSGTTERLIAHDDGELIIRALIPDTIRVGIPIAAHLEIKTKLGGQFSARQVVITIEDPAGNATAQTAAMHGDQTGHYMFHHTFTQPGHHIVRVFPSDTEAMSTIDVDVAP
jgi:protein kinase-like protein